MHLREPELAAVQFEVAAPTARAVTFLSRFSDPGPRSFAGARPAAASIPLRHRFPDAVPASKRSTGSHAPGTARAVKFSTEDKTHDDLSQLLLAAHRHGDRIGLLPKVQPLPTLSHPLGEDANKQPFQPPENAHQGVDSGSPKRPLSPSTNPLTSTTVFRYGRAGKSGSLRVPDVEERRRARERSWQYRDRQRNRESVRRE